MKKNNDFISGVLLLLLFAFWTFLIVTTDVKPAGVNATDIGLSHLNLWFRQIIGVDFFLYHLTDWLGLLPVCVCMVFGIYGFAQLLKRKSLRKVDRDIILLGIYYAVVIFLYLFFEMVPINYRPVLINGNMEASYPSSTTLLVLSVMPTLVFQVNLRIKNNTLKRIIAVLSLAFSAFMVLGRLLSGVHWFTDIVGSCLLSIGLFKIYKAVVLWNSTKNFSN